MPEVISDIVVSAARLFHSPVGTTVRDDRGFSMADRTAVGLIGRCALYLPAIRSTKGARKP